jgi:hypothetical protein
MSASIELLRAREAELECQMARMLELIDHVTGSASALELELQLHRVVGLWRAAFVLRDRLVYQPVSAGSDGPRAIIAAACRQRMEVLAAEVEEFARCWSSSALISTALPRFRATAVVLVAAMAARLDSERRLLGARDDSALEPPRMVA